MSAISYSEREIKSLPDRLQDAWIIWGFFGFFVGLLTATLAVILGLAAGFGLPWQDARNSMIGLAVVSTFPHWSQFLLGRVVWTASKLGRIMLVDTPALVLWLWTLGKIFANATLFLIFFGVIATVATGWLGFIAYPGAAFLLCAVWANFWGGVVHGAGLDPLCLADRPLSLKGAFRKELSVALSWVFALVGLTWVVSVFGLVLGGGMFFVTGGSLLFWWSVEVFLLSLVVLWVLISPLGHLFDKSEI